MYKHSILLCSSYYEGKRICLHTVEIDKDVFSQIVDRVKGAYGGKRVPFSIHTIITDSEDWDSVVKKDPYFRDVSVVDGPDKMIELLQKDRFLSGVDVAKYILSKTSCTHTRLEKLTYMCYADYLCDTGERLFVDKIYAFDHGPVVGSVYERYGSSSREHPGKLLVEEEFGDEITLQDKIKLPIKSRVLFSEDGERKVESIDRTLQRCRVYSTYDLVDITHRSKTPWDITPKGSYSVITDVSIKEYHKNEIDT